MELETVVGPAGPASPSSPKPLADGYWFQNNLDNGEKQLGCCARQPPRAIGIAAPIKMLLRKLFLQVVWVVSFDCFCRSRKALQIRFLDGRERLLLVLAVLGVGLFYGRLVRHLAWSFQQFTSPG